MKSFHSLKNVLLNCTDIDNTFFSENMGVFNFLFFLVLKYLISSSYNENLLFNVARSYNCVILVLSPTFKNLLLIFYQ